MQASSRARSWPSAPSSKTAFPAEGQFLRCRGTPGLVETTPEPAKPSRRATWVWLLVASGVWAAGAVYSKLHAAPPAPAPSPSWQRPVSELTLKQQQFHLRLREHLRAAERERERGKTKTWPTAAAHFPAGWSRRQLSATVNYVGEGEGLRWLVLFLEPDPRAAPEKAPPEDDEHHTLGDGTAIHVTVWTQPLSEPSLEQVTAFPAAEGWVERVRR